MSKAKKIVSMILAVALVLSIAPVSVFANALTPSATFSKPKITEVKFTTDTSETTDVIRVAGAAGLFTLGTTVVAATPAGIPQADNGTYINVAYADETPSYPVIVFKITGATPNSRPSVSSNLGTNLTIAALGNPETSGTTTTYRWTVTGGTASVGTDVVYTISYDIGDVSYETHAHAHVEDILIMNGYVGIKRNQNWIGTDKCRHAHIVQLQSKNMYSGMHTTSSGSRARGFINYAAVDPYNTADDQLCFLGCEKDNNELAASGSNAYASQTSNADIVGTKKEALIKFVTEVNAEQRNGCYLNDGNRSESTVYVDKRNETLQSLKMKITFQSAMKKLWTQSRFEGVKFMASQYESSNDTAFSSITATLPTSEALATVDTSNITTYGGHKIATVAGTAPALQTTVASYTDAVVVSTYSYNDSGSYDNYEVGIININFNVYSTYDLYNVYQSITAGYNVLTGDNATFTTQYLNYISGGTNTTVTFNKGAHPQESYYTGGWSTFHDAYIAAGKILAKPDTNQTEINNATTTLINAYNNLTGYVSSVNYEIKHYLAGTTTEIAVDTNNTYNQTGTVAPGSVIEAYAATITGYNVSGDTVKQLTVTGEKATETIAFYYSPKNYQVIATTYNDAGDIHALNYGYNTIVDVSEIPYGTKANWEFVGWYTSDGTATGNWNEADKVTEDFEKDTDTVKLYARWQTAPIYIYCDPQIEGKSPVQLGSIRPNEVTPVQFQRPANDPDVEGYLFVDYYEDAALTKQLTWPLTFNLGDPDRTVYGRFVDVNGKIIYESNGGTAVPDTAFNTGDTVNAPTAPTKPGYNFDGWYYDRELTDAVSWPVEMTSMTGFIAYAKWTPKQVTIEFNTNVGSNPSKYDTLTVPAITGTVGEEITDEYIPAEPRRFGYVFSHWVSDTGIFSFENATYPASDSTVTLTAIWRPTDDSAFIELEANEMILGEAKPVTAVQKGDIVTVKMYSKTNFYTGSSLFIIMYDSTFFELIGSGKDAVALNPENDYISGINAKHSVVTNSASLPWPDGFDTDKYSALQVAIDPQVAVDNYNCEPMADGTWMFEFKLRVKEDTTATEGKIFMDNAWTRNQNNSMGTMFYGWGETAETSVVSTYNNKVTPDLQDANITLKLDTTPVVETTVTLNPNGGVWADATSGDKTYTGPAGTEILDYEDPTKEGYNLTGWQNSADATDTWISGYYSPEDKTGRTYAAQWTPKNYAVKFFTEVDGDVVYHEEEVAYTTEIAAPTDPTKQGYTFAGWVDENGQEVTLPAILDTAADRNYYATWTPATDTPYKIRAYYPNLNYDPTNPDSKEYNSMDIGMTGTTGYTVAVVDSIPDPADADTHYFTPDTLPGAAGGNYVYDPDNANNVLPKTAVIAGDGSTVIELYYIGKLVNATFEANGGQYTDGSTALVVPGRFQTAVVAPTGDAAPTRYGYTLSGWTPSITATTKYLRDTTYKAQWTAKTVHVQFMVDGAQYGDLLETTFDAVPAAPTAPSKTGYNFLGWSTDPNASTGSTTLAAVTAEDDASTGIAVTYYAIFELADVYVTYYVDDEQYGAVETYRYGDSVTIREPATKKGYTFSGWKIGSNDAADFTMPAANVTIEGFFTPDTIGVVFDADEGAFTSGKTVTVDTVFDTEINLPAEEPKKTGYTFAGWATTSDADTGSTSLGILTEESATYYAVYTPNEVTYYIDVYKMGTDGQYGAAETTTGTAFVDSEVTITSHAIDGFTLVTAASQTETVPAEGELRFTVRYERNKYVIDYNVDGAITTNEYYYEQAITPIADPTKTGYTFAGWTPAVPATMPLGGTAVKADWTVNKYNVKFYTDDTKATVHYNNDHDYGTAMPTITAPTSNTHDFAGWAYEGTTAIVDITTITIPANDIAFVGIWTPKEFTLNYRTYNGVYETYQVAYGTAAADLPVPATDPTREGYTFAGWLNVPATMPATNTNIVADWTINQYTITFDVDGGTAIEAITQDYNTDVTAPADPTKTGYTFAGWDKEIPAKMPAEDVTIKANWTINQYTITFNTDGGSAVAAITQDYNTAVTAPADPTKTGYTFAGWTPAVPATMPAENVTVKAQWTINQYTITFDTDGGNAIEAITGDYGTAVKAPADPTKTGYTFAGWDVEVPATIPAENVTITAKWTANEYTITWVDAAGSTETKVTYGEAITAPTPAEKEGHYFATWTPSVPATMPAEDLTITAIYETRTYVVNFYVNDVIVTDYSAEYGEVINLAPNGFTVPEGYIFDGWYDAEGNKVAEGATVGAAIVNLYGTLTAGEFDAVFYLDDAKTEVWATVKTTFGEEIKAPAVPTKAGYVFQGWTPYVGTMETEGAEFVAVWEADDSLTVTYYVDGEVYEAFDVIYNTPIDIPADPEKVGYEFKGWAPVGLEAIEANIVGLHGTMMPATSVGYNAVFTISSFKATFHKYADSDHGPATDPAPEFVVLSYGSYNVGDEIIVPAAPVLLNTAGESINSYYTFKHWVDDEGNTYAPNSTVTMGTSELNFYPVYERVEVKLVVIDGTTGAIEKAHATDMEQWYVYGFTGRRINAAEFPKFFKVQGDGSYTIENSELSGTFGTGAKVYVTDNLTGEVVEEFYIIIFGDINGDARINAADLADLQTELSAPSWSHARRGVPYRRKAADLNLDARVNAVDLNALASVLAKTYSIDQETGLAS